jgi:peptidoglycan-associated lipoprotein
MKLTGLTFISCIFLMSCGIERKANKAFVLGKYQNSIDLYKKVVDKNQNNGKANYYIAESYRLSKRLLSMQRPEAVE